MTGKRPLAIAMAAAAGAALAASWWSGIPAGGALVAAACASAFFLALRAPSPGFFLVCLSQPLAFLAWQAAPLLSLLVELLVLTAVLQAAGLLGERGLRMKWAAFTVPAAVLVAGPALSRHVLMPLGAALLAAGVLGAGMLLYAYRVSNPAGGEAP